MGKRDTALAHVGPQSLVRYGGGRAAEMTAWVGIELAAVVITPEEAALLEAIRTERALREELKQAQERLLEAFDRAVYAPQDRWPGGILGILG
jgi:hypothetical protein